MSEFYHERQGRKEDLVPDWVHEICIAMLTNENAFWKISGLYQTWLEDMILPRELQGQKLWTCWITFLFCPVQLCFRIRQTAGLKKVQTKLGKYFTVMFYFPHSMSIIRCAISERIFIKWFCKNSSALPTACELLPFLSTNIRNNFKLFGKKSQSWTLLNICYYNLYQANRSVYQ